MASLGADLLRLAGIAALYSVLAYALGHFLRRPRLSESGRGAAIGFSLSVIAAATVLWRGLVTDQFNLVAVAQESSRTLPLAYKITAFWSGFSGSI